MNATYVRELKGLSEEDSWSLFRGKAFARRKLPENQIELEKIGKEIVKNCHGVPLSVKVMGSAMQSKTTVEDWQNISESEIWALPEVRKDILSALLLSYFNLPLHLRQCFAYCSIFPRHSYVEKEKLVKMWSAQGFVQSQGRREIEDIGREYFDDLVARSMFQDLEKFSNGKVRCKMHDLLRNLAGFIMKDESRIFEIETSDPSSSKVRHASVISTCPGRSSFPPRFSSMAEKLRTLLIFGEIGVPDSLFLGAKLLRVLDLGDQRIEIEQLPECVGELKHLRYLGLSRSTIQELPESLGRLCNLETLNLNSCCSLQRLPRGMSRMQSLRHLEIEGNINLRYLPKGLGRLTSLRTLPMFILGGEGRKIGELKDLNSLRGRLCIENLDRVSSGEEAEEAELWRKSGLRELYLSSSPYGGNTFNDSVLEGLQPPHANLQMLKILNYDGLKFPTWMEDLPYSNLVDIRLDNCSNCEQLPGLGTLPALKSLALRLIGVRRVNSEFYYGMNRSDGGRPSSVGVAFPRLECLRLQSMPELEEWELPTMRLEGTGNGEDIMPSLKQLSIFDCLKLKALPQYLPGTLTLENFKIRRLPELTSLPVGLGQLKALKQLKMLELDSLAALPDVFGEIEELEHLIIIDLANLRSLPDGLWQLEALKLLELGNLPNLTSLPDGLGQLTELKRLQMGKLPKLTSLPDGLGELKELKRLEIRNLENLTSLPEAFEELKALEYLSICDCDALASLPRGLQQLTKLHKLQVSECELLSERCARDAGADWPKISHIPRIEIFPSRKMTWQKAGRRLMFQMAASTWPLDSSDSDDDNLKQLRQR